MKKLLLLFLHLFLIVTCYSQSWFAKKLKPDTIFLQGVGLGKWQDLNEILVSNSDNVVSDVDTVPPVVDIARINSVDTSSAVFNLEFGEIGVIYYDNILSGTSSSSFNTLQSSGSESILLNGLQPSTSYEVLFQVCDVNNNCTEIDTVSYTTSGGSVVDSTLYLITSANDDGEEKPSDGYVSLTNQDLELTFDGEHQEICLLFRNIVIPDGVTVTNAQIRFSVDETKYGSNTVEIYGVDEDNYSNISGSDNGIIGLSETSTFIEWSTPDMPVIHENFYTPNLNTIVNEVVSRSGWTSGNNIAFKIKNGSGTNNRTMESFDGAANDLEKPALIIEYEMQSGGSEPVPPLPIQNIYLVSDSVDLDLNTGSYSATYYVSNEGNDSNNGLTSSTPLKTLAKVQELLNNGTIGVNDALLFRSGDVFKGSLSIDVTANEGNELYIGAYDEGLKPVIDGSKVLSFDSYLGNDVYQFSLNGAVEPRLVFLNGNRLEFSQLPKSGWFNADSDGTTTTLYDSDLLNISWQSIDNATVWVYSEPWGIDEEITQDLNGSQLVTTSGKFSFDYGEFYKFFNDVDILTENTFAYDGTYLYIKSPTDISSSSVVVASEHYGIDFNSSDYCTVDNIQFTMSKDAIYFEEVSGIEHNSMKFRNNSFILIEGDGFLHSGAAYGFLKDFEIVGNKFDKIGGSAINFRGFEDGLINGNVIKNCGWYFGSSFRGSGSGILSQDMHSSTISNNYIDSVKAIGIQFTSLNRNVYNNVVTRNIIKNAVLEFCDMGAIYTVNGNSHEMYNNVISYNIIDNVPVANFFPYWNDHKTAIYSDEQSQGLQISNNTITNSPMAIYGHFAKDIDRNLNNIYNCSSSIAFHSAKASDVGGNTVNSNIIHLTPGAYAYELADEYTLDPSRYPSFTDNVILKLSGGDILYEWLSITAQQQNYYTLPEMTAKYSNEDTMFDLTGKSESDIILKYNDSFEVKDISLDGVYDDVYGNTYNGSVTLQPCEGVILIKQ